MNRGCEVTVEAGRVVLSVAGHDAGEFFAVVAVEGGFLYLADGKRRKLESPKRKSVRHIRKTGEVLDLSGVKTNKALHKALSAIRADARR